jgi:RNA polymerase primary sigma factor
MSSKTEETSQKEEMPEKEGPETLPNDLSDAAIKKLIRSAKKRGYVTHDQINSVLPSEEVNSEQIEAMLAMFREMGVNFVETQEPSKEGAESRGRGVARRGRRRGRERGRRARRSPAEGPGQIRGQGADRTDDPARMYLREMGSVELLSREGEIAIAMPWRTKRA